LLTEILRFSKEILNVSKEILNPLRVGVARKKRVSHDVQSRKGPLKVCVSVETGERSCNISMRRIVENIERAKLVE
jgi:hypothetical protein